SIANANDGGLLLLHGDLDGNYSVSKIDGSGSNLWSLRYGEPLNTITHTTDGGFITSGQTASYGAGLNDGLLVKCDGSGNILWQKAYGGPQNDGLNAVSQTIDGGYIATGYTESFGAGGNDL